MIDEKILDEILPIPDIDQLMDDTISELEDEGFVITNFNSGGILHIILMILFRIRIEFVELLRTVLSNMFVRHAQNGWLDLKATDYSKIRKVALKTQGLVSLSRNATGEAITIPKGHVFKTEKDINGEELRFFVLEDTVLQKDTLKVKVPVEAEIEGARYNVPLGQITKTLIHLEGIDTITNETGWITREGSDVEEHDSLRERLLNSWADVAMMPIAQKYKNACEAVPGVLFVKVNDQHPRGQGTIDIIVTSPAGAATETLLSLVREAAEKIRAPYDNVLVKSSVTSQQNVSVTVSVATGTNTEGLIERVKATIFSVLKISKSRKLNELLHSDLIFAIRRDIPSIINVKVTLPVADLVLSADTVILPGTISVTIQEV